MKRPPAPTTHTKSIIAMRMACNACRRSTYQICKPCEYRWSEAALDGTLPSDQLQCPQERTYR